MNHYAHPQPKILLYDLSRETMQALFTQWGEKPIHAETLLKALYRKKIRTPEEIEEIPGSLKEKLCAMTVLHRPRITNTQTSADGTKKFLFAFEDGNCVEGVLLKYEHGYTLCLSTQKGCRMGCTFCASTGLPFYGNCRPGEIIGQLLAVEEQEGVRITNLVYMGIGEPLDNADFVQESLCIFTDPLGPGIGARHISVSTCGIVPGILRMAEEKWPCQLAVSLHYADDETRSQFMPVNRRYSLDGLLAACMEYNRITKKIVFFEYALVPGVNDSRDHAKQLVEKIGNIPCRVNLIELNSLMPGEREDNTDRIREFRSALRQAGIVVTLRPALGQDIDGACGQLRGKSVPGVVIGDRG